MSAETLRRAAALIRERAEKARTGDHVLGNFWTHDLMWMSKRYDVTAVDEGTVIAENLDRWTAEHIGGFGPAVALAVADLLEGEIPNAEYSERRADRDNEIRLRPEPFPVYYDGSTQRAISLAVAYLGGDA